MPIQIPVSMCSFLYMVVCIVWLELGVTLGVQEGDDSFIVSTFHSELYVVILLIYMIE